MQVRVHDKELLSETKSVNFLSLRRGNYVNLRSLWRSFLTLPRPTAPLTVDHNDIEGG